MKRLLLLLVALFIFSGCSPLRPPVPLSPPDFDPGSDNATLVIMLDSDASIGAVFDVYVNDEFVGKNMGHGYVVVKVSPGEKYILAVAENTGIAKIDFKPGRIYVLNQNMAFGWVGARTSGFSQASLVQAKKSIKNCVYVEYNPADSQGKMDQNEYEKAVCEYEAGVKKDPKGYKEILGYEGVLYSDFVKN